MDVDTTLFHHGRRRRIGIPRVDLLGPVRMEDVYVVDDSTGIQIDADSVQSAAVLRGCRKPNLVVPYARR